MQPFLEYHRPATMDAALALLSRISPVTRPLAGGTHFHRGVPQVVDAVVDLSELGLDDIKLNEHTWSLGAMTSLEALAKEAGLPPALQEAARREAPKNLRQSATLGGLIATADSGPVLACLLALNARVALEPGGHNLALETYLAERQTAAVESALITSVSFERNRKLGIAEVSRTPADFPIMVVAVSAQVENNRLTGVRLATGATGQPLALYPAIAKQFEGAGTAQLPTISSEAAAEVAWQDDLRASAEYRRAMLPILVGRAFAALLAA